MTPDLKQKILDIAVEYFYSPEEGMCFALNRMRKAGTIEWHTYHLMMKEIKSFSNSLMKDVKSKHPNSTPEQHTTRCYRIYQNWENRVQTFYEDDVIQPETEDLPEEVSYRAGFTPFSG